MLKQKTWQHVTTGPEGNVILFGVNIFQYQWEYTGKTTVLNGRMLQIYSVHVGLSDHMFAADEESNGVWSFYIYKY